MVLAQMGPACVRVYGTEWAGQFGCAWSYLGDTPFQFLDGRFSIVKTRAGWRDDSVERGLAAFAKDMSLGLEELI